MLFTSWLKKTALKRPAGRSDNLMLSQGPGKPSRVVLTGLAALFMISGATVYTRANAGGAAGDFALNGRVVQVDGATFPVDGMFDVTYLTNGRHEVVVSSAGVNTSKQIDVNNDLDPLAAARNAAFAGMHGNKEAVDTMLVRVFVVVSLLLLVLAFLLARRLGGPVKRRRRV